MANSAIPTSRLTPMTGAPTILSGSISAARPTTNSSEPQVHAPEHERGDDRPARGDADEPEDDRERDVRDHADVDRVVAGDEERLVEGVGPSGWR